METGVRKREPLYTSTSLRQNFLSLSLWMMLELWILCLTFVRSILSRHGKQENYAYTFWNSRNLNTLKDATRITLLGQFLRETTLDTTKTPSEKNALKKKKIGIRRPESKPSNLCADMASRSQILEYFRSPDLESHLRKKLHSLTESFSCDWGITDKKTARLLIRPVGSQFDETETCLKSLAPSDFISDECLVAAPF